MVSKVLVVCLVQTSKPIDTLISPDVDSNIQPVTQLTGGDINRKFLINDVGIILESDQVCEKVFQFIAPMAVHALEFSGDYNL